MNKLIAYRMVAVVLLLTGAMSAYAQEPDPRLAGVWKRHIDRPNIKKDKYIRVDIEGSEVFVSVKEIGTIDDQSFQNYDDAEDITVNSDGSISFNVYLAKNEYDEGVYSSTWESHTIRVKGGRLISIEKQRGCEKDSKGNILDDYVIPFGNYTYFNINDNW